MRLLSAEDETRLAERLRTCPACRARFAEYQYLVASMPRLVTREPAPSTWINESVAPSLNGKTRHIGPLLREQEKQRANAADDEPGLSIPAPIAPGRVAGHQMMSILSGIAAAILLVALVGGFWLLTVERSHSTAHNRQSAPAGPTVLTPNPCFQDGHHQASQPTCALLVMNYATTPATLVALDPTSGRPMPGLKPLPVGNALLAAVSADQRTLALGVMPSGNIPGNMPHVPYVQIVSLDRWQVGPMMLVGDHIQALAITADGRNIYAVSGTYSQNGASQALLHFFTYDPEIGLWSHPWKAQLPILPDNQSSFALSASGKTAYLFSAVTHPPQVVALALGADGIAITHTLSLPSIAQGGQPPLAGLHKPGDPFPGVYNPAVIFVPAYNRLYIVHAEANAPEQDVIAVVELEPLQWIRPDIKIQEAPQALSDLDSTTPASRTPLAPAIAASLPVLPKNTTSSLTRSPYAALHPANSLYYGRDETGTISPDGRWLYLSGISHQPQTGLNGTTVEKSIYLGVWKVDLHTGQIVERWLDGKSYSALTLSQDGRDLYLFGPSPSGSNPGSFGLLTFNLTKGQPITWLSINAGWFIIPLS